ncbi:MAG TPA: Fic family protein [Streptosporangiaceae bacterium]|nr:Fic family protein [Streptosporangiaceae bacterium]
MDTSVVFAADLPAATISDRVRRGELSRLAVGVYTSDVKSDPAAVVAREWHTIFGRMFPGAVITDRSALTGGPTEGVLYLAHEGRGREAGLPGLTALVRTGAGPQEGDIALPGGLYQASKGRSLAENTRPSRSRNGRVRRTLDWAELGDWVDRLRQVDGAQKLAAYRVKAEEVASVVGAPSEGVRKLSQMIGGALGTQQVRTPSRALTARQASLPYDQERIRRFDRLVSGLRQSAPQNRPVHDPRDVRYAHLPFFEAYFSNFIEGTEFELDEAIAVVYGDKKILGRSDDSHDLVGTYRVVSDLDEMTTLASTPDEFLQVLRSRHATILGGRPERRPGLFKESVNRAGDSVFVLPGLVAGTLRAGWERLATLDTSFERAVYMMSLVSEVHPFDDGNGRLARVMMNAELVTGMQSRIIVPTVFRDDYLGALRRMTRQDDPGVLIKALRYAHDYTAAINFSDLTEATGTLRATNAFAEPESDHRLVLPTSLGL